MLERIIGVFKLDANTFEEIEHDQDATVQAALVVFVSALLTGAGGAFSNGISGFLFNMISVFAGWAVWSAITYYVGTRFFDGEADLGEMLRVIGFAYAPQVLGIIPCIGWIVGIVWTLAATFVAVRQGLDVDDTKAAMTIGAGLLAYLALTFILSIVFGVSLL